MTRTAIAYLQPRRRGASAADSSPAFPDDVEVVGVVREREHRQRGRLGEALEQIAATDASVLAVERLGAVAGSLRELVGLLDWLAAARCDLVALDVALDTGADAGQRTVAALREVERWEREPAPGRPPRGRPGLAARAPELSERIAALRARGHSLQAIADALNDEGVPTQRGGARWRPSSVQAALGYRRPRPPLPGAPPPPPPSPHHPGTGPPPAKPRGGPRP